MASKRRVCAVVLASFASFSGGGARADPPVSTLDSAEAYSVELGSERGGGAIDVQLYAPDATVGADTAVASCTTPCVVQVPPGRYLLSVPATRNTFSGDHSVEVRGSERLWVAPRPHGERIAGAAIGVVGVATLVIGLLLPRSCPRTSSGATPSQGAPAVPSCSQDFTTGVPGGLVIAGLITAPVGWILFGHSFSPVVTVEPTRAPGASRAPIASSRSGSSSEFGLRVSF